MGHLGSLTKDIMERRKPLEECEERFDAVNATTSEKGQTLSREVRLLCSGQGKEHCNIQDGE